MTAQVDYASEGIPATDEHPPIFERQSHMYPDIADDSNLKPTTSKFSAGGPQRPSCKSQDDSTHCQKTPEVAQHLVQVGMGHWTVKNSKSQ